MVGLSSPSRRARSSTRKGSREKSGIKYRDGDRLVMVDPRRVVDKARQVGVVDSEAPWGDEANELPALTLPGHGEAYTKESEGGACGEEVPHFCEDCGKPIAVGRTCYRSQCPRCAPAWVAMKRAKPAGAKLEGLRRYLYSTRGQSPRFHHLVLSPPDGFATLREDPLGAAFEIVKEITDALGVDGGLIAYHPWRGVEDDDRGFWKEILFKGTDWEATVERLEYGPHFHVIAVGRFVPGQEFTQRLHEQTGWTFKRITKGGDDTESNVSLYDTYDLVRALTYTISHTGLYRTESGQTKAATRYFGQVANFQAEGNVTEEIDAAVRSVAPNTLGLSYRSNSCARELDEDEEATGAGPPSNGDPDMADTEASGGTDRCGGRLVPIERASEYLTDPEWVKQARHVDELADRYLDWRLDRPPPGRGGGGAAQVESGA